MQMRGGLINWALPLSIISEEHEKGAGVPLVRGGYGFP
jgi:hypothetical protein